MPSKWDSDGSEFRFPEQEQKDPAVIGLALADYLSRAPRKPDGSLADPARVKADLAKLKGLVSNG